MVLSTNLSSSEVGISCMFAFQLEQLVQEDSAAQKILLPEPHACQTLQVVGVLSQARNKR